MNILLVSATEVEIQIVLENLEQVDIWSDRLKKYRYKQMNLDVLVTGIGMINTAFHLGKTLSFSYDFALNVGIAGSFDKAIDLGTVLHIVQDEFTELGAEDHDNFISLIELGLQKENSFPYTGKVLINTSVIDSPVLNKLPKVSGITVNTVHGNAISIKNVIDKFSPTTESMEGAAFLLACLTEKIPCAQIRAISNYVEPRNKEAWNIPLAVKNLNDKIAEILNELSETHE